MALVTAPQVGFPTTDRLELSTAAPITNVPSTDVGIDFGLLISVLMSSLGILGNAMVCFVMLSRKKVFYSTTNKLIIHQSFVDTIASTVFLVRRFALASPPISSSFLGELYCRVWWSEWPMYAMFVTSTYNLLAISVERYLATCHSVRHRNAFSSSYRLRAVIIATWVAGWLPAAHLTAICFYDRKTQDCNASWPSHQAQAVGGTLIFIHEIIVPVTLMVFAYSKIIWTLRQRSRLRDEENNTGAREMFSKANRNVSITLIVVAVFFAICWLPTDIYYLLYNLKIHDNFVGHPIYQVVSVVVVLNLCINPFIYCFAYDRFRRQLRDVFCGRRFRSGRVEATEDGRTNILDTRAQSNVATSQPAAISDSGTKIENLSGREAPGRSQDG